jgi:hypothetical protein
MPKYGYSYSRSWATSHPGCLIFLLDQSSATAHSFGAGVANRGARICDMVAVVINGFLQELILMNTIVGNEGQAEVRSRANIAVLGYGGAGVASALGGILAYPPFVTLLELEKNPAHVQRIESREIDPGTGMEVLRLLGVPIWVQPKAEGSIPMCAALRRAKELASQWAASHPDNYPPVVINVTAGQSTDGNPSQLADELRQIRTSDGHTLLYNVHITERKCMPVFYPAREQDLLDDASARLLFHMSSVIPDTSRVLLQGSGNFLPEGVRGMIYNGDATSVRQMFRFGTVAATTPLNPNM